MEDNEMRLKESLTWVIVILVVLSVFGIVTGTENNLEEGPSNLLSINSNEEDTVELEIILDEYQMFDESTGTDDTDEEITMTMKKDMGTTGYITENGISWYSYYEGLSVSEQRDQPVMVYFYTDSCGYCKMMEDETFTEPEVQEKSLDIVFVKVDANAERGLASKYDITGVPTTVFIDSNENILRKEVGFMDADQLITVINDVISNYDVEENGEASSEDVPRWVEGDYWHYNRTEKEEKSVSYTMRVSSEEEVVDIDGTRFECYMVNYTWVVDGVPEMETHFYTTDDLSLVGEITEEGTYAYSPPVNNMDFPLEVGKEWTSSYIIWKESENGGTWELVTSEPIELRFNIEGREIVNVPAGTFETYIINMTQADDYGSGDYVLNYYAPVVNNMVMIENFQTGGLTYREELMEYNLEEREEAVVDEYDLTIHIDGNGTVEVNGQEVEDGWRITYEENTDVNLEAILDSGQYLDKWTGEVPAGEEDEEITVTMDQDRDITAHFGDGDPDYSDDEEDEGNGIPWWILPITAVIVIALVLVIFFTKKKGKDQENQQPTRQLSLQQQPSQEPPFGQKTQMEKLEELKEMEDKGLISQEEFERKKEEILDQY